MGEKNEPIDEVVSQEMRRAGIGGITEDRLREIIREEVSTVHAETVARKILSHVWQDDPNTPSEMREKIAATIRHMLNLTPIGEDVPAAPPENPARIVFDQSMEDELAPQWSEPLRPWADMMAESWLHEQTQHLSAQGQTFRALADAGLIEDSVEGVIAFQWWMTKKNTAPGWNEPAPSPAATFKAYAEKYGGQKGL